MPDLVLVPAEILPGAGATFTYGTAGVAITAGQVCYLDGTTRALTLADANGSVATAAVKGIAMHGATTGQPLTLQRGGDVTLGAGAALTVGGLYVLSSNPGMIAPAGDLAAGHFTTLLGVAVSATALRLQMLPSGVAHG
jgi:hypothetical protein